MLMHQHEWLLFVLLFTIAKRTVGGVPFHLKSIAVTTLLSVEPESWLHCAVESVCEWSV